MARYELLERIGIGGMAEIFRGKAVAGGGFEKDVAIKRILPHLSQDQRFVELLIAEAKILSELRHRNIVQIYDVGLGDDGQYFLVMEFVDGTDLKHVYEHLFDGRRLPVEVSLHICSEICEALEHAHNAKDETGQPLGLVHRDVSPSNVLLSKSGEVKLTDFGIAKRVEEVTGHGGVRGKFAYISPEQAVNKHVDGRSDVYSVGILLYELATGQRLFSGLGDFDALRAVRQGQIRPDAHHVTGVDPRLADLIMRSLSREPSERFQSAGEFGAALRGYRYSLETKIADPAAEIADLVLNEGRRESEADDLQDTDDEGVHADSGGSTVVRISTAAEFSISELSGLHKLVNSYPEPRYRGVDEDAFDDMQTAALSVSQLANRIGPALHLDEDDDAMTVARTDFAIPDEEEEDLGATVARTPDFDMTTAAPENAPADDLFAARSRRAPRSEPVPLVGVSGPVEPRPATPTERDVFHGRAIPPNMGMGQIPAHYPGYLGRAPGLVAIDPMARRRKIQMGVAAGVLALVAFIVAGQFLGGDAPGAAEVTGVDADLVDASANVAAPTDAGVPPDAATKIKKKRRHRKKRRRRKKKR